MSNHYTKLLIITYLIFSFSNSAMAQGEPESKLKVGIGVSLFNYADIYYEDELEALTSIHIPLDFKGVRIEPSFGLVTGKISETKLDFGLGAFIKSNIERFNVLYGLRLGIITGDLGFGGGNYKSIAPTVGGEYFLHDKFSIGCEAQLKGIVFYHYYTTSTLLYTNGVIMVRFYP